MTSKEIKDAIEIFETLEVQVPIGCKRDFQVARYLAIEALEKQIAKKPELYDGKYYCTECDGLLFLFTDSYCSGCGQAIDWSEEE